MIPSELFVRLRAGAQQTTHLAPAFLARFSFETFHSPLPFGSELGHFSQLRCGAEPAGLDIIDLGVSLHGTCGHSRRFCLTAKAAGRPLLIDHRAAVATREQLGGDLVAWINYQPLWQDISRSEPDLLS